MTDKITITRKDGAFIVTIDGGSIECGTAAEVMSRVGHEMGMPFNKAQRQLFEKCKTAEAKNAELASQLAEVTKDRDRYKDWWYKLYVMLKTSR